MSPDPADEYRARLTARRATHAALVRTDARLSYARLGAFGVGVLLGVLGWLNLASSWLLVVPVLAFTMLIQRHDRVIHARDSAARAIAFYERGLARIEDRWTGLGEPGDRFLDQQHIYAHDLDLFGRGSLFELLSVARTRAGEEMLADWLKRPADPAEILARQEAVAELSPSLDLREALSLAGLEVRAGVHNDELVAWAKDPEVLSPRWLRWIAVLLTASLVAAAALWLIVGEPAPLIAIFAVQVAFALPQQRRVERALRTADRAARDLDVLSHLLTHLEPVQFSSASLTTLGNELRSEGRPASRIIRSLHRLVELHDWQHNVLFAMLSMPLMWGTHLAWAIEAWRRAHGGHVRRWLAAVARFEALSSLAAYRFEHPDDPFPQLATRERAAERAAAFEGVDLGHPLLPAARMVRNDVRLMGATRLLVVSGSNMSGKSTLLRTVGINAVMALAGAPVRARALRLTPLVLGATLRIQDSLQEGRSRFYAEITRIRELSDAANGPVPLLFLLDELFHGTNSHDRLVGAAGVLRNLLDRGAIGLITTHDLAVTAVAETLSPRAVNVHFEDWFEGNEMKFDYRVKPGPVVRSNAIALMRAVGLDVAEPQS